MPTDDSDWTVAIVSLACNILDLVCLFILVHSRPVRERPTRFIALPGRREPVVRHKKREGS